MGATSQQDISRRELRMHKKQMLRSMQQHPTRPQPVSPTFTGRKIPKRELVRRPHIRCETMVNPKQRCLNRTVDGHHCLGHGGLSRIASVEARCHALTRAGNRCSRHAVDGEYCKQHGGLA